MGDEDTVILTPEERDRVLSENSEEEQTEEEQEDES